MLTGLPMEIEKTDFGGTLTEEERGSPRKGKGFTLATVRKKGPTEYTKNTLRGIGWKKKKRTRHGKRKEESHEKEKGEEPVGKDQPRTKQHHWVEYNGNWGACRGEERDKTCWT